MILRLSKVPSLEQGFSLIELMVATSLIGFIFSAFGVLMGLSQNVMAELKEHDLKNDIQYRIISSLYSEQAMRLMCLRNTNLRRCFLRGAAGCISSLDMESFSVFSAAGDRISGSLTNPVYYDANGAVCGAPSSTCVYVAETAFRTQGQPERLLNCSGDCRSYSPTPVAPVDHLHELLIVSYSIRRIEGPSANVSWTPKLPDREGSVIIGLHETYSKYSGCPNP